MSNPPTDLHFDLTNSPHKAHCPQYAAIHSRDRRNDGAKAVDCRKRSQSQTTYPSRTYRTQCGPFASTSRTRTRARTDRSLEPTARPMRRPRHLGCSNPFQGKAFQDLGSPRTDTNRPQASAIQSHAKARQAPRPSANPDRATEHARRHVRRLGWALVWVWANNP
jgi:hypothetical protein